MTLEQERDELEARIDKLTKCLQSDKACWLERDEYENCCKQRSAMTEYLLILNSRIERQGDE